MITVKELRKALSEFDKDKEVLFATNPAEIFTVLSIYENDNVVYVDIGPEENDE